MSTKAKELGKKEEARKTAKSLRLMADIKRYSVFLAVLIAVGVLLCLQRISYCDQNCTYEYNPDLEGYVNELQTDVTKVSMNDPEGVELTIKGRLQGITQKNGTYIVTLQNYFNQTAVSGSIPEYTFPIRVSRCADGCEEKVSELMDRLDGTPYNELTKITLKYELGKPNMFESVILSFDKLFASLSDFKVDVSSISHIELDYSVIGPNDIEKSCSASISSESALEVGKKMYFSVLDIVENDKIFSSEGENAGTAADRLLNFGWFDCLSCTGECMPSEIGIGLDYAFFPLLAALLEENGVDINSAVALDVLAKSYDVDSFESFKAFTQSDEGWFDKSHVYKWGSDPICGPYWVARQTGTADGVFYEVTKKLCAARADNVWMGNLTDEQHATFSNFTDDAMFSGMKLLFDDMDTFKQSDLVVDKDANGGFIWRAMDDYIYGYDFGDETFVEYGNEGLVLAMWNFVERFERDGGSDSFQNKNQFRDLALALLLKKQLAADAVVGARVDELMTDLINFIGDPQYVNVAYDLTDLDFFPDLLANEKYRESLGDLLLLWATDPEFYSSNIQMTWEESTKAWFYKHYLSGECGKADLGLFAGFDSDGKCMKEFIGLRSNISTMIYLLLLYGDAS